MLVEATYHSGLMSARVNMRLAFVDRCAVTMPLAAFSLIYLSVFIGATLLCLST